jgi:hypothetical protein
VLAAEKQVALLASYETSWLNRNDARALEGTNEAIMNRIMDISTDWETT